MRRRKAVECNAGGSVPLRCLIVDDNACFMEASRTLLEKQGISVVGVAMTAAEGLQGAEELEPDVVLVDIDLGADSGFDLARLLADEGGPVASKVILISTHSEEDFADLVAESPALGFLAKSDLSARAIEDLLR
jgi:two-component system, NarL family, nitrate/nitrite response regulator NarL